MPPALLLIASAGLLGAMLAMRPASAQNSLAWELCAGNGDPPRELQASACNLVIQSGKPAPANLAHAHRARALAYLANRQSNRAFLEAIKQYDQALARDAKMILEWFFRDALDLHDYDRAIANFSRQILLDSTIDWPWYFRGVAHLGKKDYNSAISDFDAALRINPELTGALYLRGVAKLKKGDNEGGNADIAAAKAGCHHVTCPFVQYGYGIIE